MPGRSYTGSSAYRYNFNGKESDPEAVGTGGGTQDYGLRIYNPSLGKFLSVDPLTGDYPWNSTYSFAENDVIRCIDLDGGERRFVFHQIVNGEVQVVKTVNYKTVFPKSGKNHGDMGTGTLHFYSIDDKSELVTSLYDENDDLSSNLSSVSINLRGGGGAGPIAGSIGPSVEMSDESIAGSFNGDGNLNSQWKEKPSLNLSIDIGFKFSGNTSDKIKSEFKTTMKFSDKMSFNILGTGVFIRTDVDLQTFDRTYRVGVDFGPKMTLPYNNVGSWSAGFKGVASLDLMVETPANKERTFSGVKTNLTFD